MFSSGLFGSDELHAHSFGALSEISQDALAVTLLVVVLPLVGVFRALGEHGVDQPGELVRGGGHGLGLIHP